jgi:hypothetical protein
MSSSMQTIHPGIALPQLLILPILCDLKVKQIQFSFVGLANMTLWLKWTHTYDYMEVWVNENTLVIFYIDKTKCFSKWHYL